MTDGVDPLSQIRDPRVAAALERMAEAAGVDND